MSPISSNAKPFRHISSFVRLFVRSFVRSSVGWLVGSSIHSGMYSPKDYGFSAILVRNRVLVSAILVSNRVWVLHSNL